MGLYVHVPFCSIKCFYCDFTAFSGQRKSISRYLSAITREASFYEVAAPRTLYVGGGTPTELSAQELSLLFGALDARFGPLEQLAEATVEANPESTDAEKLGVMRRAGVTRLSFGLQTTDDGLLRAIGRKHTFADFRRVYDLARREGFQLSVDLMTGLPGQSIKQSRQDLDNTLELQPDHFSVYSLSVEDRTLFSKRRVESDDATAREMTEAAYARLEGEGYAHYEISNFAHPGKESLHNINYWLDGDYLGLGCGAAGHVGSERYQNEERLEKYLRRVEAGERPVSSSERLEGKEKIGERILLRLRLIDGFSLTPEMQEQFRPQFERLLERGLIEMDGGGCSSCLPKMRLTHEGKFLANEAFREFVAPF
jgi:oxygen-independent coproporphyrinogen-3 oxidase